MAVYLILLGLLLITAILELFHIRIIKEQHQAIYWGLIIALVLVAGLRYGLEEDYWHYYHVFNGTEQVSSLELGFKLFNSVIHIFFKNYGVYCFIVAIISMGIKGKYFGKLKYPFIALLCYYLRFYVLFELNAIRQGMAMAFVIIAIYYLINNDKGKYCLFTVIALSFHSSAVCVLLVPFIKKVRLKLKHILFIYCGCLIFRLVFFNDVIASFAPYISGVLGSTNNLIHGLQYIINSGDKMQEMNYFSLARVIIPGICLYFITNKANQVYYDLYFTGSVLNLLFWGLDTIAFRIPAVFYIFEVYILNDALVEQKLFGKRKKDWIFTVCLFCVAFCDIWTFASYLIDSRTLIPYRTVFGI